MKFFHISDLHLGKRVCGFSMLEEQRYILRQILEMTETLCPDGVLVAGDLYDKPVPAAEAVELADWFLSQLAERKIPVWVISGNHDSAERIAYGGRMMEQAGVFMSRVFDGRLQGYTVTKYADGTKDIRAIGDGNAEPETQEDNPREDSPRRNAPQKSSVAERVDIYLLPYLRPLQARRFFPEQEIQTTQQAVEAVLAETKLREDRTNILVLHQFIAGAAVCDSEELTVGGLDQIEASVLEDFDYVALGHLHRPQKAGRETVRYCGSPLKYSFSEAGHEKSVTVIETGGRTAPHEVTVSRYPLTPRLDLREIRGPLEKLLQKDVYGAANPEDYLHVTLTDEGEILDAIGKLREVYPNIMRLDFERASQEELSEKQDIYIEEKTPAELFADFFVRQNGREMSAEQKKIVSDILEGGDDR